MERSLFAVWTDYSDLVDKIGSSGPHSLQIFIAFVMVRQALAREDALVVAFSCTMIRPLRNAQES
jgi:hypothetical protein